MTDCNKTTDDFAAEFKAASNPEDAAKVLADYTRHMTQPLPETWDSEAPRPTEDYQRASAFSSAVGNISYALTERTKWASGKKIIAAANENPDHQSMMHQAILITQAKLQINIRALDVR